MVNTVKPKRCVGFGEFERKCTNEAGTAWTPYWCERCDKMRRDHITKQLKEIAKHVGLEDPTE